MIHWVCLASCSHLAAKPRLVKEADALTAAGLRVRWQYGRDLVAAAGGFFNIVASASDQAHLV